MEEDFDSVKYQEALQNGTSTSSFIPKEMNNTAKGGTTKKSNKKEAGRRAGTITSPSRASSRQAGGTITSPSRTSSRLSANK